MSALSISALAKSFRAGAVGCSGHVSVLRALSLELWPGEIVAVEGASGCGKSTLLQCAAGLLRPDSGAIRWDGARAAKRGAIAYVSATSGHLRPDSPGEPNGAVPKCGAVYDSLRTALPESRLVIVDDLATAGALERRLALSLLRDYALSGAAILLSASEELATDRCISRTFLLTNGALVQRRNRSAARIAASSFASRARASARSTYGRSLRSPQ